ncbi:MAG: enoyl-CoA hydratase-related protein [Desulfobacula sp.]|nr:enoyl-CoA hydratase-related protein [Desulfobacula sp.]
MAVSYILPRLVGVARANELLFTGKTITGQAAARMGLINDAVNEDRVMDIALDLAREIAKSAPAAVQMMKQSIYRELDWQPVRAAEIEALHQARTFGMEDSKEGIAALLEKRAPNFKGK